MIARPGRGQAVRARSTGRAHAAEALAANLPALLVEAEQVASAVAAGVHGRRRAGQGDSFWEYRPIRAGEPATRIDWRRSARSGRAFVRETEWEAAQTICLWRAADAGMQWRSTDAVPTKEERATVLMLALASLLLKAGERPRLVEGETGLSPVVTGPHALERLAARLAEGLGGDGFATHALPAHGRAVLFGDFLAPLPEIEALIGRLAAAPVAATLVQVLDPAEIDFPFTGRLRFRGTDGEAETLAPRAESLRDAYRARLAAHRDGISRLCTGAGFGFLAHATDGSPLDTLLALHRALAA